MMGILSEEKNTTVLASLFNMGQLFKMRSELSYPKKQTGINANSYKIIFDKEAEGVY